MTTDIVKKGDVFTIAIETDNFIETANMVALESIDFNSNLPSVEGIRPLVALMEDLGMAIEVNLPTVDLKLVNSKLTRK